MNTVQQVEIVEISDVEVAGSERHCGAYNL